MQKALLKAGAMAQIVAPRLGSIKGAKGTEVKVDHSLLTAASVLFDAVYLPGGEPSVQRLLAEDEAPVFVKEAWQHCKAIAAQGAGVDLLTASLPQKASEAKPEDGVALDGVVTSRDSQSAKLANAFIAAIAQHRHWNREKVV